MTPTTESDLAFVATQVTEQAAPQPLPRPLPTVSDEAKVAFLAHILTGVPFSQRYDIAGIGFIEFATVTTAELEAIRHLAIVEEVQGSGATRANRNERITRVMAAASARHIELDGRSLRTILERSWQTFDFYDAFIERLPVGTLAIVESYYAEFSRTFSTLIEKVPDRSFWSTP